MSGTIAHSSRIETFAFREHVQSSYMSLLKEQYQEILYISQSPDMELIDEIVKVRKASRK